MRRLATLGLILLAGCASPQATTRQATPEFALPPMKTFARPMPQPAGGSNAQIARDFLDLSFRLEGGEELPVFTRFEGPVTVRVLGARRPTLEADLDRLIARLRSEAGLTISRVGAEGPASVTVEPVSRGRIKRVAPGAACFVRPNVSSWKEYRARRNDPATFWTRLGARRSMAVFIPDDVSPQEMRDCLHEEIAQGLGPVNDVYRLTTSVFNDDNFHAVLTGYDMLILRVTYDPALRSGMTRQQVAQRLPEILARLNPRGGPAGIAPPERQLGAWERAIADATLPGGSDAKRLAAARRAVMLAGREGPRDARLAFSYYVLGRQSLSSDPAAALQAFLTAGNIYRSRPDALLQEAHVALQIAAFQLSAGEGRVAEALIDRHLSVVRQAEHASLLALMLFVQAEAVELQDQPERAARIRREGLAWGRYGFGTDEEVRRRAAEILAISPRNRQDRERPA